MLSTRARRRRSERTDAGARESGEWNRATSAERLAAMLADPKLKFTLVPQNVVKFVRFKARIGNVRTPPESWKDLFFPEIHDLPGS